MQTEDFKPNILYVDDEEENLMVFKSSFRRNYNISIANSAMAAREMLNENTFDVIISDQRMPGITGVEFLKNLPDEPNNIRMILTGFSDMEAIIDAINSGKIYKYITKPWQRIELQKVIDEALSHHSLNKIEKEKIAKVQEEKKLIDNLLDSKGGLNEDSDLGLEAIRYKKELEALSKQVAESNKNVQLLSEIGHEIISNLTIESIIESTYENVNTLMDAFVFGIGIYVENTKQIEFPAFIESGKKISVAFSIDDENRFAVWCYKNCKDIFINDNDLEHVNYIAKRLSPPVGNKVESLIYLPLIIKDNIIGVITVQSLKKNSYSNYHLNILRNIGTYVATALENAKAYNQIETQKTEIEQKNIELENKVQQRTEQLQQKNEEILKQNDQLEATYRNVKLLSEIGQQITATLSLEKIIETVYENVNSLMEATIFSIGVFNPNENRLEFPVSMEKGEKLPFWFAALDDENRIPVWCFKNQKEVIINDYQTEYNKYIKNTVKVKAGGESESLIYLPLMTNDGPIGVITVQSFKKHIYYQYHIDILRSLASYITIAIQNSASYRKMTQAFEDLKAAQMKLVEAEKMASLGVLTAGVAHEINNPVNFISGGIESLELNYNDVEELLKLYLAFDYNTSTIEEWERIQQFKSKVSPDELLPEMAVLISSIKSGALRTAEIVKGLKNFTRLDENDMKKAKIEEGIDNTLVILNNKLKNRIEVNKDYADIPEILCYPGQLNQVFMNLLHNASDAIEGNGTIHIKTWKANGSVNLSFKDSGKGMPEDIVAHIFEPFYTTKEVGKGTGLGLSIAYGIIEKHGGTIEVKSEVGKGTEFILSLPIK